MSSDDPNAGIPNRTPAGRLVAAFGDAPAMRRLYADEICWTLPAGLGTSVIRGIDAVAAFNTAVWRDHYLPDCDITILDEAGNDAVSAVRFRYRAILRGTGAPYDNEYTLFARSGPDGITAVHEAMDTVFLLDTLAGDAPGTSFRRLAAAQEQH